MAAAGAKTLACDGFKNYRLKVYGLVENPVELSPDDLRAMGKKTQITLHHCIQGWSGIAEWGGVRMAELMKLVRPMPAARVVVFCSFGEGGEGGQYYDSHTLENVRHPQALLAYEMNFQPLDEVHGAPLRLRVENQLGFKMVKWIQAIEFVDSIKRVYKGEGGYNAKTTNSSTPWPISEGAGGRMRGVAFHLAPSTMGVLWSAPPSFRSSSLSLAQIPSPCSRRVPPLVAVVQAVNTRQRDDRRGWRRRHAVSDTAQLNRS